MEPIYFVKSDADILLRNIGYRQVSRWYSDAFGKVHDKIAPYDPGSVLTDGRPRGIFPDF